MTIQKNNPLHGLTLQLIVETLVERLGWEQMHRQVKINCFSSDPSVKSSLKFLRKTPWARSKVEELYLNTQHSASTKAATAAKHVIPAEKSISNTSSSAEFVWPEPKKSTDQ